MNEDILCIADGSLFKTQHSSNKSIDKEIFPLWMRQSLNNKSLKPGKMNDVLNETLTAL